MADGVLLYADHYAPIAAGRHPTVLIRSPYGRGLEAFPQGLFWGLFAEPIAERGYHVLVQTTRGQHDSGGSFTPYLHERADGQATIAWLHRQPWYNGQLAMWGPSYFGFGQWAVADNPDLRALVPIITCARLVNLHFPDRAFGLEFSLRWAAIVAISATGTATARAGARAQLRLFGQLDALLEQAQATLPLELADTALLGQPISFYQGWLESEGDPQHPIWRQSDFSPYLAKSGAATHMVAGWYDLFLRDQLADYAALVAAGQRPYLTVGPWGHFGVEPLVVGLREGIIWLDATLKAWPNSLRQRPVRVYLLGAEQWRELEQWPPAATTTPLYLQPGRGLADTPPADFDSYSIYTYNPADPTPAVGGPRFSSNAGRVDNRELEARTDLLVFTGSPLELPLELIGPLHAQLYVQSSSDHTDFFVRLSDLGPDGVSRNICDGLVRLSPGAGQPQPDGALLIDVDMWATAYRFLPGHRMRVVVASGAHPRWARNLGAGEPLASASTIVRQHQTIYHDAEHPSALLLPVMES